MTPIAYLYISIAYFIIAVSTTITLCIKGYLGYNKKISHKYLEDDPIKRSWRPFQYILHSFHIPPYLIASYWYYDSYINNNKKIYIQDGSY